MTIKTNLAARANYGSSRATGTIKYIVLHYTGNDGDTDESNGKYFRDNDVGVSAHYFVDDDSVTRSVPDNYVAWAVGGKKCASCAQTGGGKFYGKCTNANSISIEMCDSKKDGTVQASDETIANAQALTLELMKKYNVPVENVIRHFDVTGKLCPAYMVDEKKWAAFKAGLEDDMKLSDMNFSELTDTQVEQLFNRIQKHLRTQSATMAKELKEAKDLGITDGTYPLAIPTREQVAVMVKRGVKSVK